MKKAISTLCILLCVNHYSSAQNGLDFDGANDVVQTNYAGVTGTANRTFEAWIYVGSSAPASNLAILDYGLNAVGSRNTFFVSGTRELRFISGGTSANIQTPVNSVPINQWVHVAFVLDNSTGYLYINGSQMGTGSLSTVNTPSTGAQNVKLGQRVTGGNIPFQGSLDEIRIWDVARTAAQIQADMNAEFCSPPANLQLYLKLNEGSAGMNNSASDTAADYSGNGYHGTLTNFSLSGATSNWVTGSSIGAGSATSSIQERACKQYMWPLNSVVYTTTGVYTETLAGGSVQGCDSVVTLNLTIDTVDASVSQNGIMLAANATALSYQWVNCPGYTPIVGDTNQTFTATVNGDYALIITDSLCSDTSACYNIASVGMIENHLEQSIQVFPNPSKGDFSIAISILYSTAKLTLTDLTGKRLQTQTFASGQLLKLQVAAPAGVYLLLVEIEGQQAVLPLVKE